MQGRWSRAFYFRLSALFLVNPFTIWETGKGYNYFKNCFDWLKVEKAPYPFYWAGYRKRQLASTHWVVDHWRMLCWMHKVYDHFKAVTGILLKFQFLAAL